MSKLILPVLLFGFNATLYAVETPMRLAIIGDSTVCEYPPDHACRGWGHYIQDYFKDTVYVINLARSGRSTKTFIKEGLWSKTLDEKPDIILIQFGHNDSHSPDRQKPNENEDTFEQRRSSIQVVELKFEDGWLTCNRDKPTYINLKSVNGTTQ